VSACLEAYRVTQDRQWYEYASQAFGWFLGRNALGVVVYDKVTGGCRDGLHVDRLNENQGAESTLSFLQSLLEIQKFEREHFRQYRNNGRHAIPHSFLNSAKPGE
jgi:hypothetical protein